MQRAEEEKEAAKRMRGAEVRVPGGLDSHVSPCGVRTPDNQGVKLVTADVPIMHDSGDAEPPKDQCDRGIPLIKNFSSLLERVWDVMKNLRNKMNERWQSTTALDNPVFTEGTNQVFPLPTSQASSPFSAGTIAALNDLAGFQGSSREGCSKDIEDGMVKSLEDRCARCKMWEEPKPDINFSTLFKSKTLDYSGEEIKVAQSLNWEAVSASLPDGVGTLALEDYCVGGTLEYVQNFESHLLPPELCKVPKPPRVMVEDGSWTDLCRGLVEKNICEVWPKTSLFQCNGMTLLNGLFAVGKGEYQGPRETQRLIMNLTPLNSLCRSLEGDVSTLPGLSGFGGFLLDKGEVALISSEDIKCFFYLFSVPESWKRYLGFNREVPGELLPRHLQGQSCVLVSRVLPMGYLNSVSIAQHIHRNIVKWSSTRVVPKISGEAEMRKDKPSSSAGSLFRIYLDNFDQLERVDKRLAENIQGTVSAQVLQLRHDYQELGLPRHPKKAVQRAYVAEIQGALFDGYAGFAMPKPQKIWQYALLGWELVQRKRASLKELQVVCGGFVYIAMFRRPLLGALNEVWRLMETLKKKPGQRMDLTPPVLCELCRFILLLPLAQMEFRSRVAEQVTCSDASMYGGGICVSEGLTQYGVAASNAQVRGDVPEPHDICQVLTVGLFDGIGALRVAADSLGLPVAGHISVEMDAKGRRVVESWFPDTMFYEDVTKFGREEIGTLALRYSNVGLIIIGAGPPCQGVSGLNVDKKGALRDARSSLFQEVPRIEQDFRELFPWAQVHRLMESVASMAQEDREIMSEGAQSLPFKIDSIGMTLCHRPRLYWCTWELQSSAGAVVAPPPGQEWKHMGLFPFLGSLILPPCWSLDGDWLTNGACLLSRPPVQGSHQASGLQVFRIAKTMSGKDGVLIVFVSHLTSTRMGLGS